MRIQQRLQKLEHWHGSHKQHQPLNLEPDPLALDPIVSSLALAILSRMTRETDDDLDSLISRFMERVHVHET